MENTPDVMTRLLGNLHLPHKEDLYLMLANDEINLSAKQLKDLNKTRSSLLSKILRNPFSSKKQEERKTPVNRKVIYVLHPDEDKPNYKLDTCCQPIPGDDVLGFVDENEDVVVHKVSCPNAMRLKSSFGSRLVATKWGGVADRFLATISIDGIDRRGILEEITGVISRDIGVNMVGLTINARQEVFHCEITLQVDNSETVENICRSLKEKIKGVKFAKRIS